MTARLRMQVAAAADMEALGGALAQAGEGLEGLRIYLRGDLGTGKTTLVRGFLHAAGHVGPVRSPTYTLVEPYPLPRGELYHLDLYRLAAAEELEYLGLRDLEQPDISLLVEWPQQGDGVLPPPDLEIVLDYDGTARQVELQARSARGDHVLQRLKIDGLGVLLD